MTEATTNRDRHDEMLRKIASILEEHSASASEVCDLAIHMIAMVYTTVPLDQRGDMAHYIMGTLQEAFDQNAHIDQTKSGTH
jgi:hypothetical protein